VRVYLKVLGVEFADDIRIYSFPFCRRHPSARIQIGSQVAISNTLAENPAGISHRSVLVATEGAHLKIGNHVGMSGVVLYCTQEIVIDDYVNLGVGVKVYDTDFHPVDAQARRSKDATKTKSGAIHIGQDAWVGADAMILKGVTIGARAIVAAGAIVTRDVPADSVAVGIPATPVTQHQNTLCEAACAI